MHVSRKRAVAGLSLAVAATGFLAQPPASANPAGTGLVISEVYGAGGNAAASYNADYVELYNPTGGALSLSGLSLQYRSATGGAGGNFALSGAVAANSHFLVQLSSAGATGAALPTPDATAAPAINMSGTAGQALLVNGTAAFVGSGNVAGNAGLVDMVGYGTSATTFEASPTGAAANNASSFQRSAAGADTDVNTADFSSVATNPENGGGITPPPDEFTGTIAEIQGTGAISPHVDDIATTRGVVTAAYPTGGLSGFYIQTEGTGGATDETPGASDAIFVFGSAAAATVAIGDFVEVVGPVREFAGTTEITAAAADVTQLADPHDPVTPQATLPGSDCVLGSCPTAAELTAAREAHEGEAFAPTAQYIAQNAFSLTNGANGFMEIGLAASDKPLVSPTEIEDAQTGDVADVTAYNNAHAIALDDGSSLNYTAGAKDTPMPWITADHAVRVGAAADFTGSVVLEFRNNAWKLQPQAQITDLGTDTITFAQTRTATPEDVGGDLKLGTFNVLNYFNTTGQDYNATHPGACTFFTDRASNPITVNNCTPTGPRGAARTEDFERQQGKIVTAINAMDVDIVSLEEIENSIALGEADRDDAVSALVAALNADAGSTRWAFAPSPAVLPDLAEQDVIRTAFIYNPATVDLVGPSKVLVGSAAFANAREPLAQAFVAEGGQDADAFGVIVNHFKSKGSGFDDGTGQGNANPDRIAQANALVDFADAFKTERSIAKIFLTGDFNAYSEEDPVQVLEAAGYTNLESDQAGEESYSFSGLSGSLDHVFANAAALPDVEGVDIWDVNAGESIAYQYGRFNYNATQFFDATNPFGASDHNPELVGINVADTPPTDVTLNLLGVNDFHGRINANTVKWAGTVEQLRAAGGEGNTVMIGAGDLIGASEFASAIADDQPTIDMFNALDLDASAVGNHEFDKGWADLRDRVIGAPGAENAEWDYLGANVYADGTEDPVLPEYGTYEKDGLTIGVIGVVTEETSTLVSPGGITEIDFGNPTDAVNRVATELSDGDPANGEADVIIASYHSGAQLGVGSTFEQEVAKGGEFAEMVNLDPAVDVIFNGHTHQTYAWDAPIPGQPGKTRPIIQTGEYGANVGQVQLTVDGTTGDVVSYTERNVARTTDSDASLVAAFPRVANVKSIVDAALAHAAEVGNQPVGTITSDVTRALSGGSYVGGKYTGGTVEDRGSESALGDLVANALRDGLPAENGPVDLGIVNPGGLRAELKYAGDTSSNPLNTDGVVTYAEANGVLPFVNNIWTIDLTGAQLKTVLEQQWQTNPGGPPPARPFLALGLSDNVRVTQDASKPEGSRITSVVVDGENLDPTTTYRVSTFSFLGTGGDNFRAFTQGTHADTGLVDRDLWIGYLQDHAGLAPDFARQQVAESGLPADVTAGENVSFTLSKLNLTSLGAPENTSVAVYLRKASESRKIGDFPVTNGTASVAFTAPANLVGRFTVAAIAEPSVTQVGLPLTASATSVTATADPMVYGSDGAVEVTVTSSVPSAGGVEVLDGDTVVGTGTISGGLGTVAIPGTALAPGSHTLTVNYLGDAQNNPSSTTVRVTVAKATSTVAATVSPAQIAVKGGTATVHVTVSASGVTPTGVVGLFIGGSLVGGAALTDGAADLTVGPYPTLGQKAFQVRYLGDDFVRTSLVDKTVQVVKATPTMTVTTSPNLIRVKKTKPVVTVRLAAAGFSPVTGSVRVVVGGDTYNKALSDGTAVFTLKAFKTVGTKQINVTYLGTSLTNQVSRTITVNVVR